MKEITVNVISEQQCRNLTVLLRTIQRAYNKVKNGKATSFSLSLDKNLTLTKEKVEAARYLEVLTVGDDRNVLSIDFIDHDDKLTHRALVDRLNDFHTHGTRALKECKLFGQMTIVDLREGVFISTTVFNGESKE